MQRFHIRHTTTYRYAQAVTFGEHRLMVRPRGSHDLTLRDSRLTVSPPAAAVRWLHDVFGNSIAILSFDTAAATLTIVSDLLVDHYPLDEPDFPIAPHAETYPFSYTMDEAPDLAPFLLRHYPDPDHAVDRWAKGFVAQPRDAEGGLVGTQDLLERIARSIRTDFVYAAREAEGTQAPAETLERGSGSCRDFALLMIEAVRGLGFAARFVSGYLYDPAADTGGDGLMGAGATHAWVQVYLPGAGWTEFDPTNGLVGGKHLLRVAVARDPSQAVPLTGDWVGAPADFLGMTVAVRVARIEDADRLRAPSLPATS